MRKGRLVGWWKENKVPGNGEREKEIYFIPSEEEK